MRRKIQDLICGKFETPDAGIEFDEKSLKIIVPEGESRKVSFSFSAGGGTAVRGLVSCADPRMQIASPAFDALHVTVTVQYDAGDLIEHDSRRGEIILLTNAGEYFLPYEVEVTKDYAQTSIGRIRSMTDFTNLARLNWQEALTLFRTARFTQIFHAGEEKEHMLYRALTSRGVSSEQMEEFLVACGRKARNHFIVSDNKKRYLTGELPIIDKLRIEKTEWGYLQYTVTAEGDFIEITGNPDADTWISHKKTEIPYRILPEKMHGGINYGKIIVEDILERVEIGITAVSEEFHEQRVVFHPSRRLLHALQQCFLNYFMGRIRRSDWAQESLALLQQAEEMEPLRPYVPLLRAYICHENGQDGDDERFESYMAEFKRDFTELKATPVYALYAYMTTFTDTDTRHVRFVTSYVRELCKKYEDDPLLAWILLRIDETLLRNDERAYLFIRDFMGEDKANPFFYLEAYFLLKENPDLAALGEPGIFEQRLLRWIVKNGLLTEQIMLPVWEKLRLTRSYSAWCFEMLTAAYQIRHSAAILKEICRYLIRTESTGSVFLPWYKEGVQKGLRIAGLYEAYIRCFVLSEDRPAGAVKSRKDKLPPEIIKYFIMSDDAPWKWKAAVYAYLIEHQKEAGEDWQKLRPVICDFGKSMMSRGEIDPDLYVIYLFLRREIGAQEWLEASEGMRGSRAVRLDVPKFKHVFVYEADTQITRNIPIRRGQAFVRTSDAQVVILLQDARECLYTTGGFAGVSELFEQESAPAGSKAAADSHAAAANKPDPIRQLQQKLEQFTGSLKELDGIVAQAREQELYCLPYEEKLLTYMLFADRLTEHHAAFFADVSKTEGNERLCDAYISVLCRNYITQDQKLHDAAKDYLLNAIARGRNVNAFCRTAVLKLHYRTPASHILTESNAERLLLHLLNDGLCFSFFNDLPKRVKRKFLLEGLLFVQCSEKPKRKLFMTASTGLPAESADLTEPEFTGRMPEPLPGVYCFMLPVMPGSIARFRVTDENGDTIMLYEEMIPSAGADSAAGTDRYRMLSALFEQKDRDERAAAEYAAQNAWMREAIAAERSAEELYAKQAEQEAEQAAEQPGIPAEEQAEKSSENKEQNE